MAIVIGELNMTTWEEVVKFLYAKGLGYTAGGALRRVGGAGKSRDKWGQRLLDIWATGYVSPKAKGRAHRTNDLRYARALDKGD